MQPKYWENPTISKASKGQLDLAADVRISYLDVMDHTLVRQKKLMDQYYFLCQCDRCMRKQFSWKPIKAEKVVSVGIFSIMIQFLHLSRSRALVRF